MKNKGAAGSLKAGSALVMLITVICILSFYVIPAIEGNAFFAGKGFLNGNGANDPAPGTSPVITGFSMIESCELNQSCNSSQLLNVALPGLTEGSSEGNSNGNSNFKTAGLGGGFGSGSGFSSAFSPSSGANGGSGAIWTTRNDCGDEKQDVNHYNIGETVYINGRNFDSGEKSWKIEGLPGGASCDPDLIVASGTVTGADFCFAAYVVKEDDCGEYHVKVGSKGDNYNTEQCDPSVNLISNGGFEIPVVAKQEQWDIFPDGNASLAWRVAWQSTQTVYGNRTRPATAYLELQRLIYGWAPAEGSQYAELDSDWDGPGGIPGTEPSAVRIYQNISTVPGNVYELRFAFSARPGTNSGTNTAEVMWGGETKAVIDGDGTGLNDTDWVHYSYNFTASSPSTALEFAHTGIADSLGAFIDDVQLRCLPRAKVCGNGRVDYGEECDDGNQNNNDGCSSLCALELCTGSATSAIFVAVSDNRTKANGLPAVATWNQNLRWTANITDAAWIWTEYLVSDPVHNTTALFGRTFEMPANAITGGNVTIAADNSYVCSLNNNLVGANESEFNYFEENKRTYTLTSKLTAGLNTFNCTVKNWEMENGTAYINPAGLLYRIEINVTCPAARCGDGILQQGEQCESDADCSDGNPNTIDACLDDCSCNHACSNVSSDSAVPITNDNADDNSPMGLQAKNGDLYIVYQHWNGTSPPASIYWGDNWDLYILHSADNGTTWSSQRLTNKIGEDVQPYIIQDTQGTFIIVYESSSEPTHGVYMLTSSDGTVWSEPRLIAASTYDEGDPTIVQGPDGTYYVAYEGYAADESNTSIFIRYSANLIDWSNPIKITDIPYSVWDPNLIVYNDVFYFAWSGGVSIQNVYLSKTTQPLNASSWIASAIRVTNSDTHDFEPNLFRTCDKLYLLFNRWNATNDSHQQRKNLEIYLGTSANDGLAWSFERLTNNPVRDDYPSFFRGSFNPDKMTFARLTCNNTDIMLMHLNLSGCQLPKCGNGILETGEECDDGNLYDNDGCSAACKTERCGDGIINGNEECDDGNVASGDGCSSSCLLEKTDCLDGFLAGGKMMIVSDTKTLANGNLSVLTWNKNARWTAQIAGAKWIWSEYLVSDPVNDTFVTFDRKFHVPPVLSGMNVSITIAADNSYVCSLNGLPAGQNDSEFNYFEENKEVYPLNGKLIGGNNTLRCTVKNWAMVGGTPYINPAGLLYRMEFACGDMCDEWCQGFCGDGVINQNTEQCDDGNTQNGDGCSSTCTTEPATIIAAKIVCANEPDLPNWGKGGPDITATTAQNFIASHPNCHLENNWSFQWGYSSVANPGDHTGEASNSTGWHTFGPTNSSGQAAVKINNLNGSSGSSRIWVREVFKPGYLHFTYITYPNNSDNVSAEMYCHQDVLNYDNYDFILGPKPGGTYYCIAFNVLENYCGDGTVKPPEQCELPGDQNNNYCIQSVSDCNGFKLGTRDAFGDCGSGCGCAYDPFVYSCVKGECEAQCAVNGDCPDSTCSETYDDYCSGLKLVEYNSNKIKDSTVVSNSVPNTCLDGCECTKNPVECGPPETESYCVKDVCYAQCANSGDCDDGDPNTLDTCLGDCSCKHEYVPSCGNGILDSPPEQCERPDTNDNVNCVQSTSECQGFRVALRDAYGNCDSECGCVDDPLEYQCVKGECGAECASDGDCDDGDISTADECADCICRHEYQPFCGNGKIDPPEECEFPNTLNNNYCAQITTSECQGYKLGTRDAFGDCGSGCGCAYDPFVYSCVKGQCGAVCDSNDDCTNYCSGNFRYYNGVCRTCSTCSCSYSYENCNYRDGWYTSSEKRWEPAEDQCMEKEQVKKEYRDYSCAPHACAYTVTKEAWEDTGQTRNKQDGTACDDGFFCTVEDQCSAGTCSGQSRQCNDGNECTDGSCNEQTDSCEYVNDDTNVCGLLQNCPESHCEGVNWITFPLDGNDYCTAGECMVYSCEQTGLEYSLLCDPDSDNDGVPDSQDACPQVYGTDCNGCPNPCTGCASMICGSGQPTCGSNNSLCVPTTCPLDGCGLGGCPSDKLADYPVSVDNACSLEGNLGTCAQNTCAPVCVDSGLCQSSPPPVFFVSGGGGPIAYCGDGTLQKWRGEECEKNADCNASHACKDCKCVFSCAENWSCSEWGACSQEGVQTRACADSNKCNTTKDKPSGSQSCTYTGGAAFAEVTELSEIICGNGNCDEGETCDSCPEDCGACAAGAGVQGTGGGGFTGLILGTQGLSLLGLLVMIIILLALLYATKRRKKKPAEK